MTTTKHDIEFIKELSFLRQKLGHGENTTQSELDQIRKHWSKYRRQLRPRESNETFHLVDSRGNYTHLTAARWLCHLLGLRHRTVHILLRWQSPNIGNIFVLQVRSWQKSDSPGHLDISVGGHVANTSSSVDSAYREMAEELGLNRTDLDELKFQGGYESYNKDEPENFYNAEWSDVYLGVLRTESFNKLRFSDGEVVGLYLCPQSEAENLLKQQFVPLANALKTSLPFFLNRPQ